MYLIALTGGIGSGKTTVANIFRTIGIPVYDSDRKARQLMNTDIQIREQIIALLGEEAYAADQELNRSYIASRVFDNPDLLRRLNAIVHPAVRNDLEMWAAAEDHPTKPYLIQESAIVYEENLLPRYKAVILVVAPVEIRIARIINRDNVSKDKVLQRIENQWPDEKKIPLADYIIFNDGERSLIDQVVDIDRMIQALRVDALEDKTG